MTSDAVTTRRDLMSRSWTTVAIGIGLLAVGAIVRSTLRASSDPTTVVAYVAFACLALGGMAVQAAIVGFVFGSYDGVRRSQTTVEEATDGAAQSRAAGWYDDPQQPGVSRWWDGWDWTATRADDQA